MQHFSCKNLNFYYTFDPAGRCSVCILATAFPRVFWVPWSINYGMLFREYFRIHSTPQADVACAFLATAFPRGFSYTREYKLRNVVPGVFPNGANVKLDVSFS